MQTSPAGKIRLSSKAQEYIPNTSGNLQVGATKGRALRNVDGQLPPVTQRTALSSSATSFVHRPHQYGYPGITHQVPALVAGPIFGCDQITMDQHGVLFSQPAPPLWTDWCFDVAFLNQMQLQQTSMLHGPVFSKEDTAHENTDVAQLFGKEKDATKVKIESNDASTADADSSGGAPSADEINSLSHDGSSDSDVSSDDSCSTTFEDCCEEEFFDSLASPEGEVELLCEKAQTTTSTRSQPSSVNDIADKNMLRTVRCLLNKVTAESIGRLSAQIIACDFEENEFIFTLVEEVFAKGTRQHNFIPLYVDLCSRFHKSFLERKGEHDGKLFRRSLLCKCQEAFQEVLEGRGDNMNFPADAREEAESKRRSFVLGVFKFIGALLANGLLASCILPKIIDELLQVEKTTPKPSSLEFLTVLLTTVGSKVDFPAWAHHQHFCQCFDVLSKLQVNEDLPIRTRCLLINVLDLRAAGWQ